MTLPYRSQTHGPLAGRTVEYDFEGNAFGITDRGAIVTGTVAAGVFTPDAECGSPVYRPDRNQREIDGLAGLLGMADMAREAFPVAHYCVTAAGSTDTDIVIAEPTLPNMATGCGHWLHILDKGNGPARDPYLVDEVSGGDTITLDSAMAEDPPAAGVRCILIAKRKPLPDPGDFPNRSFGFKRGSQWYVLDCVTAEVFTANLVGDILEKDAGGQAIQPRGIWDWSAATITGMPGSIGATFDGGGNIIEPTAWEAVIPFAFTISALRIVTDQTTDLTITLATQDFATYTPGGFASITGGSDPLISGDTSYEDTVLAGFSLSFPAHTVLQIAIGSVSAATRCSVALDILKG